MPSSINATKPVDAVAAAKADLRANLAATKTELEHGGFVTQVGAVNSFVGQLERATESRLNDLAISVRDYGAVGDETSRPVSQWFTGGARDRGYANLAALQVHYPHVTAATDEIDWAAIQKALNVGIQVASKESRRVVIPAGIYYLNKTVTLDRNLELVGAGLSSTWLKWTAAHTSGPCMQIKPNPTAATILYSAIRDLSIDAVSVPTSNVTNHGIEFYNTVQSEVRRVGINQPKGNGILMRQSFFCTVESVAIDRSHDSMICLRSLPENGTDGFGDGGFCSNGNHFHDIFLYCNYHYPVTTQRPRLIELFSPCEGNFFNNVQVQTGTYRLDDAWIYNGGFSNYIRNFYAYDGPGAGRTCTTSVGAGSTIRMTFAFMPNLVTGDRITATGITGITNGTLYTVTSVSDSEFIFDVTGTTYSGSPQTGRIVRGGNITATAAGGENRITCTCANHNLYTGQTIVVAGITNGSGTQSVIRLDRNTFQIANSTFGGSSQTGTWTIDRPTSVVQFGDPSNTGPNGLKCIIENFRVVADHDDNAVVVFCNFVGGAVDNRIHRVINDQGGDLKAYLIENGSTHSFFTDWLLPNLPAGTDRLKQFTGYGVDYSPALMCKDFTPNPPGASELEEGQVAFSVVAGQGARIYWKKGVNVYQFNAATSFT